MVRLGDGVWFVARCWGRGRAWADRVEAAEALKRKVKCSSGVPVNRFVATFQETTCLQIRQ